MGWMFNRGKQAGEPPSSFEGVLAVSLGSTWLGMVLLTVMSYLLM